MSRTVDDDLFKDSTMTFGEHLEEFRGALARALVGLVLGFLIALPFADDAVRFVSGPLEKALARLHVNQTTARLKTQQADAFSPEDWQQLEQEQMVPSTVQLDVDDTMQQLVELGVVLGPVANNHQLTTRNIPKSSVPGIAESVCRQSSGWRSAAGREIWNSLSEPQQTRLRALADTREPSDEDQSELLNLLNGVLASQVFSREPFLNLKKLFPNDGQRRSVAALRDEAAGTTGNPENTSRLRLNRLLLAAALKQPSLSPQKRVVDIRVWKPSDVRLQSLGAQEPFLILIKAALILGLLLSSPWVFFHLWSFVAAGLYPHEKNYVYAYLPFSLGLFFLGATLAFAFVFEPVLDFLFGFNLLMNINAAPRISEWVSFVLFLPVGFGISFQLPLVMLLLERIGVTTIETYVSNWRIAVLIIFVISMFLTPADPMSMMLMGIPLTVLFFGGIALCKYLPGAQPRNFAPKVAV